MLPIVLSEQDNLVYNSLEPGVSLKTLISFFKNSYNDTVCMTGSQNVGNTKLYKRYLDTKDIDLLHHTLKQSQWFVKNWTERFKRPDQPAP